MISFNKFPVLSFKGSRLVWDSRQPPSGISERVYIPSTASPDVRDELLRRPNWKEIIEGPGSELALGRDVSEALQFPSKQLKIIGVTGTNGKTSSTHLMAYCLACRGHRVLQIGTLGLQVWEGDGATNSARVVFHAETGFTTPEAPSLHDLFRQAVEEQITHVVMEVSSHALELGRVAGVEFDGALFTNLSQDHLDFHKTMDRYGAAKRLLFERELKNSTKSPKFSVIGLPDETSKKVFREPLELATGAVMRYIRRGENFEVTSSSLRGLEVAVRGEGRYHSHLVGVHNAWNLTLGFTTLKLLENLDIREFEKFLQKYPGVPGRFERIGSHAFVDYAHTPDALEKTLETLRATLRGDERLAVVFGCGGDRDQTKRPLMGEIAGRLADVVWITNDNPRTEEAGVIIEMIRGGVREGDQSKVRVETDRRQAIARALTELRAQDVLVVCGKGHEDYQIIGTEKHHFSDQECIRDFLETRAEIPD